MLWVISKALPLHVLKKVNTLADSDPDDEVKGQARQALTEMVKYWKGKSKDEPETAETGV